LSKTKNGGVNGVNWSKDGNYLTYESSEENAHVVIKSFHITTGKIETITTTRLNSYNAQFTPDGKWLYFVSERNLTSSVGSPWGARQPEPYYDKTAKIYGMPMEENQLFPFYQTDGWLEEKKEDVKKDEKSKDEAKPKTKESKVEPAVKNIDWLTAAKQLYEIPLPGKNILRMRITEKHIYWAEMEANQYNKQKLYALKIGHEKQLEPTLVAEDINGFDLSPDKKKLIIEKSSMLHVSDADGSKVDSDKTKVDLSNWVFQFDPMDDWKQMFNDAWRMERDYFYDRNLHGVDWPATRKRYETLLPRTRSPDSPNGIRAFCPPHFCLRWR
jgi:tricorn protease